MVDCDWLLSVEKACDWLRIEPGVTVNFFLGHPVLDQATDRTASHCTKHSHCDFSHLFTSFYVREMNTQRSDLLTTELEQIHIAPVTVSCSEEFETG